MCEKNRVVIEAVIIIHTTRKKRTSAIMVYYDKIIAKVDIWIIKSVWCIRDVE